MAPLYKLSLALLVILACAVAARKYDADKTYVHIVPHTHDDVGWLKTVDEYFYGGEGALVLLTWQLGMCVARW